MCFFHCVVLFLFLSWGLYVPVDSLGLALCFQRNFDTCLVDVLPSSKINLLILEQQNFIIFGRSKLGAPCL